ncbi:1-phosphatidylinositol 4,5-bisphosphate phosphodiesterase delta-3-like, partial [Discoglossus pictus]
MIRGSMLWKIKSGWRRQRLYRLESDGMTIWYQSQAKRARSKQIFSILHIESVREGRQSEGLQKNGRRFPESCCFSIAFTGRRKNLDLAAETEQEAWSWIKGLRKLLERAVVMSQREKLVHWIRDYLHQADRDGDEKMTFQEVKDMLRMINIDMNDIYAYTLFKNCDRSNTDTLEDCEIEEFCIKLMHRPELESIFSLYSGEDRVLSAEELMEFLRHQGEEATLERARKVIHQYELNETARQHDLMMQEGFMMYLLSVEGDIFNPAHRKVYQDMTQPLTHYYISSSHNTYLTNHQLVGSSSTEAYVRAFMDGCRCVELDCWEGPGGEPVIYHGHTLTSKILFKDVITTIRDYAFKYSPYPVILSLENHCGLEQQVTMAQHLLEILGDLLVTQPLESMETEHLPSPEALKRKILLKGKKLSENWSADGEEGRTRLDTAPELSDLVIYCQTVEYRDQPGSVCEMSSFSEDKVRRLIKESGNMLVRYNIRQLSRIYPDGLRTNSSNYSPQEMWNAGCQLDVEYAKLGVEYFNLDVEYPNLDVEYPNLDVEYPNLGVEYPNLDIEYANLGVEYANLGVEYPNLGVEYPNLDVEYPNLNVEYPNLDVEYPNQDVEYPNQDVEYPNLNVEYSNKDVEYPNQDVEYPNQDVEYPNQDVEYPNQDVEYPNQDVEYPNQDVEYPNQDVEYRNLGVEYRNLGVEYLNLGVEYSNLVVEYRNLDVEYSNLVVEYRNLDVEYRNLVVEYPNLDVEYPSLDVEYLPIRFGKMPP